MPNQQPEKKDLTSCLDCPFLSSVTIAFKRRFVCVHPVNRREDRTYYLDEPTTTEGTRSFKLKDEVISSVPQLCDLRKNPVILNVKGT